MKKKRIYFFSGLVLFGIAGLLLRLVQIQLLEAESFSKNQINLIENSVNQRTQQLTIDEGRGTFLDKNGESINYESKNVLILFPFLAKMNWDAAKVANILGVPKQTLHTEIEEAKAPFVYGGKTPYILNENQMSEINNLKLKGVFALKRKYPKEEIIAEQLIGLTGENEERFHARYPDRVKGATQKIGISGLERSFDEWLIAEQESKLIYHVDARGGPLFGVDVKYLAPANPFYPLNIVTTIDSTLQEQMEELIDRHSIKKGGAVLLDIETGDIVASVSRPSVQKGTPFQDDGAKNLMASEIVPGSVFKTVVASAAIDLNLVNENEVFNCDEDIYGVPADKPHGIININESFAVSCNRTFAEISKNLTEKNARTLDDYAEKLGLIGDIGWKGSVFHYEDFQQLQIDSGRVFINDDERKDANFAAQTGIGQREVRVTPIGVANMMSTIARGGRKQSVRVVSGIRYKNGTELIDFPVQKEDSQAISPYTAMKMQQYLRNVVAGESGTATFLQTSAYEIAGKTGTAQTGQYSGDKELYNKWFAGYFPFDNPKYALAVVNMDVMEYEGGIYPVFKDITDMIHLSKEAENE
ncbi:peptidoglycan D,D-transpeptidase FtsI family protein [Rossellomorea aquimaris]|uniref:serine-type D-Ala-D-Ala carboxypeptidase n=1 Tax=Rossellomorea aquimaris TaxID=189382 RepID=A0A5D4UA05_9BACI|nr:penicillin-binding protein 2 [Rossellomorea aquimaris]TYS83970.1 penicillin-binding protein 2 [Rossellomorea aquimaris]